MNDNDRIRLQHMLEAAREAVTFIEGMERDDLARDRYADIDFDVLWDTVTLALRPLVEDLESLLRPN